MTASQKIIKILTEYPDLGNFDRHYTSKQFFVSKSELKIYTNSFDYHGKSGEGDTRTATDIEAEGILEEIERRLAKELTRKIVEKAVDDFYSK